MMLHSEDVVLFHSDQIPLFQRYITQYYQFTDEFLDICLRWLIHENINFPQNRQFSKGKGRSKFKAISNVFVVEKYKYDSYISESRRIHQTINMQLGIVGSCEMDRFAQSKIYSRGREAQLS